MAVIEKIGTAGGTGYAIEHCGEVIRNMSIEGRMTVCNMAIEAGARAGLVAFDKSLNRLGYGAGYYDRLIEKLSKKKKILKIGLALSVQKINNVPITKYDKKLDYIVTDQYIL